MSMIVTSPNVLAERPARRTEPAGRSPSAWLRKAARRAVARASGTLTGLRAWLAPGGLVGLAIASSFAGASIAPAIAQATLAAATLAQAWLGAALAASRREDAAPDGWFARLCGATGRERGDCSSVLASAQARWFGVPLAALGAGYALSVFSLALIAGTVPAAARAAWMLATALLTLGLVAGARLSWVQARVLRRWCGVCSLFHAAGAVAAASAWAGLALSGPAEAIAPVAWLAAGLPAALLFPVPWAWGWLREQRATHDALREQWTRLTADPNVLIASYLSADPRPVAAVGDEWVLGRKDAPVEVVVFSHPLCPHCAVAHSEAESWVSESEEVKLTTRLVTVDPPAAIPEFLGSPAAIRPLELSAILYTVGAARGPAAFHAALSRVFAAPQEFIALTPTQVLARLGLGLDEARDSLAAGWRKLHADAEVVRRLEIRRAPLVFVNGRLLPTWADAARKAKIVELVKMVSRERN